MAAYLRRAELGVSCIVTSPATRAATTAAAVAEALGVPAEPDPRPTAKAAAERVLAAVRGGASLDDAVAAEDAKLGDDAPAKPEATTTRSFGRADDPISGPFDSGPLVNQVFAMPPDEKLPAEPLQLGKEYIVYELLDRERPDRKDFTDDAQQRLRDGLRSAKARDALDAYVDGLRKQAQTDGAIKINPVVLSYENARQS